MRPRVSNRTVRHAVFLVLLLLLACGEDGDHYAPPGADPTSRATVVAGTVRDGNHHDISDALVVIEPAPGGVPAFAQWLAQKSDVTLASGAPGAPGSTGLSGTY